MISVVKVIRFEKKQAPNIIRQVVDTLKQEKLVILPTDTVYGIMALAASDKAVSDLYAAKKRPVKKPTALLVSSTEMAQKYIGNDIVTKLGAKFWPGPLTIVSEAKKKIGKWEKLGVRVPDEPFLLRVLEELGEPVMASSANVAGEKPPTKLSAVSDELAKSVSIAVDKGPTKLKAESTIIEISKGKIIMLREGPISLAGIAAVT